MTTARSATTYGVPFKDALVVDNPETTETSLQHNYLGNDVAQMSCTTTFARVRFATTTTDAPVTITPIDGRSHLGVAASVYPIVAKTATGVYTVTYPPSWQYQVAIESDGTATMLTEPIVFRFTSGRAVGAVVGHVQTAQSLNVITVRVFDPLTTFALSDLGGGVVIEVEAS